MQHSARGAHNIDAGNIPATMILRFKDGQSNMTQTKKILCAVLVVLALCLSTVSVFAAPMMDGRMDRRDGEVSDRGDDPNGGGEKEDGAVSDTGDAADTGSAGMPSDTATAAPTDAMTTSPSSTAPNNATGADTTAPATEEDGNAIAIVIVCLLVLAAVVLLVVLFLPKRKSGDKR